MAELEMGFLFMKIFMSFLNWFTKKISWEICVYNFIGSPGTYRVFKKEGEKVNGYYATKNWILGAI